MRCKMATRRNSTGSNRVKQRRSIFTRTSDVLQRELCVFRQRLGNMLAWDCARKSTTARKIYTHVFLTMDTKSTSWTNVFDQVSYSN